MIISGLSLEHTVQLKTIQYRSLPSQVLSQLQRIQPLTLANQSRGLLLWVLLLQTTRLIYSRSHLNIHSCSLRPLTSLSRIMMDISPLLTHLLLSTMEGRCFSTKWRADRPTCRPGRVQLSALTKCTTRASRTSTMPSIASITTTMYTLTWKQTSILNCRSAPRITLRSTMIINMEWAALNPWLSGLKHVCHKMEIPLSNISLHLTFTSLMTTWLFSSALIQRFTSNYNPSRPW